jgi:basic membrane protein A
MEVALKNSVMSSVFATALAAAAIGAMTAPASAFLACAVTDTGGADDKGFNQYTWAGVQEAAKEGGFEAKLVESKAETDYVPNINSFLDAKCDIIVTIGFLMGDATKTAAEAHPDTEFTIVDFAYDPPIPNVLGQVYATNQGGFLAGYLAAGVSKTGVVGTFGGMHLPHAVTDFMDGYVWGVDYYNKQKGTSVKVLGWDPGKQDGVFVGDFSSLDKGKDIAKSMMDEGADVILPVAGGIGTAVAALAQEVGPDALKVIGVDTDQYNTDPDHSSVYLSSVLKRVDSTTKTAVTEAFDGSFKGGLIVGDLKSGGVDLAPFHDMDSAVPAELKDELAKIKAGIIDGSIKVGGM